MKIFVAGHMGLIGSSFMPLAKSVSPPTWVSGETDVYVNCVGYTNVDECETDAGSSYNSNVAFVAGTRLNAKKYVHLSTDFIFDGRDGPYREDAKPAPLSVYGAQKWIAETLVQTRPKHLIVRTTCVYGWHAKKQTFAHWVKAMCEKGQPFRVTQAQITTPTYAPDLARIMLSLIEQDAQGVVNVTSGEYMSRFLFARDIAEAFGYDKNMILPDGYIEQKARRPKFGGLRTDWLRAKYKIEPQHTPDSLKEMVKKWGK